MNCPLCKTELEAVHAYDIEIDRCPCCDSIWLDHGELEQYRKKHPDIEEHSEGTFRATGRTAIANCPRCEERSLIPGDVDGMNVTRCEQCHGTFLPKPTDTMRRKTAAISKEGPSGLWITLDIIEIISWGL